MFEEETVKSQGRWAKKLSESYRPIKLPRGGKLINTFLFGHGTKGGIPTKIALPTL